MARFGTVVENMLLETDKKGKPIHRLEDILRPPQARNLKDYLMAAVPGGVTVVRKGSSGP